MRMLALWSAALFVLLTVFVALGLTRGIDLATTLAFQSVASYPLDVLVNWHTLLGQLAVTLPASAVLAVMFWRRYGGVAWLAPLAILATGAIELVFKLGLVHPGPPEELTREFLAPLNARLEAPSSFPSGHMARLTFLAVMVAWLLGSRAAWIVAVAWVALSLYARVYIGDHWLSDAVGGAALGAGIAALALSAPSLVARRQPPASGDEVPPQVVR